LQRAELFVDVRSKHLHENRVADSEQPPQRSANSFVFHTAAMLAIAPVMAWRLLNSAPQLGVDTPQTFTTSSESLRAFSAHAAFTELVPGSFLLLQTADL